jgi:hypothetical protein
MFTKTTFALATASGALVGPASTRGLQYYGNLLRARRTLRVTMCMARTAGMPAPNVRFELRRDLDRGY